MLGQPRTTQRRARKVASDEGALHSDVVRLASRFGRYGYRRVTDMLRIEGWGVNHKRVERIWRQEGLKVPQRQPKRGRLWLNDGSCIRLRPLYRGHVCGELLAGGEATSETCYAPTVLYEPPGDVRVSTSEIFGPVVCVYPYDDIDDAIARSNSLPYAFQASVFTGDIDTALRASRRLDASAVMVNDHPAFRVDWMPFAGLRESGIGVGGIPYTMKDMQIKKLVVVRSKEL